MYLIHYSKWPCLLCENKHTCRLLQRRISLLWSVSVSIRMPGMGPQSIDPCSVTVLDVINTLMSVLYTSTYVQDTPVCVVATVIHVVDNLLCVVVMLLCTCKCVSTMLHCIMYGVFVCPGVCG